MSKGPWKRKEGAKPKPQVILEEAGPVVAARKAVEKGKANKEQILLTWFSYINTTTAPQLLKAFEEYLAKHDLGVYHTNELGGG